MFKIRTYESVAATLTEGLVSGNIVLPNRQSQARGEVISSSVGGVKDLIERLDKSMHRRAIACAFLCVSAIFLVVPNLAAPERTSIFVSLVALGATLFAEVLNFWGSHRSRILAHAKLDEVLQDMAMNQIKDKN